MTGDPTAKDFWGRALKAITMAELGRNVSPDDAASRAYYAAFHAVSALFAVEGKTFTKHQSVEAAVHRDLVRSGKWNEDLGDKYKYLHRLRQVADYGGLQHVSDENIDKAIGAARDILNAVSASNPEVFELKK